MTTEMLGAAVELALLRRRLEGLRAVLPVGASGAQPALVSAERSLWSAQQELDQLAGAEARAGVSRGE